MRFQTSGASIPGGQAYDQELRRGRFSVHAEVFFGFSGFTLALLKSPWDLAPATCQLHRRAAHRQVSKNMRRESGDKGGFGSNRVLERLEER